MKAATVGKHPSLSNSEISLGVFTSLSGAEDRL